MKRCLVVTIFISCHELHQAQEKPFTTQGETETARNITEVIDGISFHLHATEGRTKQKNKTMKSESKDLV